MDLEATVWLRDDTEISSFGESGGIKLGNWPHTLAIHSVLAKNPIAAWKKLRDACEQQIYAIEQAEKSANGKSLTPEDLALADKIIASGDLDGIMNASSLEARADVIVVDGVMIKNRYGVAGEPYSVPDPIPAPQRIEQVVKIPAPMDDSEMPF